MTGKLAVLFILLVGALAGIGVYYTQVHAYYTPVDPGSEQARITLTPLDGGAPQPIEVSDFTGIDANSSPIRFRACFRTPLSPATLSERFAPMDKPVPLVAPGWFDCFDAEAVGEALEAGQAKAFLGQHDLKPGIDRVVAVFPDGRAFAWNQTNSELDAPNPVRQ